MSKGLIRYFALYGAAFAFLQGLSGCDATPAEQPVAQGPRQEAAKQYDKLVVAFGDSLYAGYGLGPSEGFAPQLQAALEKEGLRARVHNAGVSGDTTGAAQCRNAAATRSQYARDDGRDKKARHSRGADRNARGS